jgi:hypothetical protein
MKKAAQESFPLGHPSTSCGEKTFNWLISPVSGDHFVSQVWERKPHHVKRGNSDYYGTIMTRKTLESWVKNDTDLVQRSFVFSRDGGEGSETITDEGVEPEAFSKMIDEDGWSVQVVHPQQKSAKVHALVERLENFTGSVWGANFYRHPDSNSDVFSAYSDNVDLFILVLGGSSRWRVYEGDSGLSRDSGSDFTEEDLGPPVLDATVAAGDFLYIPRGAVYSRSPGAVQYLTLSTYHQSAYCDLLQSAFTDTLETVTKSDIDFRRGLPFNWTSLFGRAIRLPANRDADRTTDISTPFTGDGGIAALAPAQVIGRREALKDRIRSLFQRVVDRLDLDDIADQLTADFVALRTPPAERKRPGASEASGGTFGPDPRQHNDLKMRIRNPAWIRITTDTDEVTGEKNVLIFSCIKNDITNHMRTDNPMEADPFSIEIQGTRSIEGLQEMVTAWPGWVDINVISRDVSADLWESCIIETTETAKFQKTQ